MTTTAYPERIGPYRILSTLGRGGMGTVFLAQQDAPMKRQVALKVLRDGLQAPRAVARFEVEREALALMAHPGIARVFDAGIGDQGHPWVAMEYIVGASITDHCAREGLSLNDRIRLLIDVCSAIEHAHQKGVIHRDLKPSNVLVTLVNGRPTAKVIDFGLARRVDGVVTSKDGLTEGGALVGTPAYMSPEQVAGRPGDIDTRTDVYGLGVLTYELVTGEVPHGPPPSEQAPFLEVLDKVLKEDPLPPSARVSMNDASTLSRLLGRSFDSSALRRRLHGDLDRVVLKALEKDRDRRYASARELGADLQRYLDHEPVLASPPSKTYRLRKFVRRHRVPVLAATAVLLALVSGLVVSLGLYRQAEHDRDAADRAREEAERLVGGIVDLRASLEPLGRLDLLDAIAKQALAYYERNPPSEPDALHRHYRALRDLGVLFFLRGDADTALATYREVIHGREELEKRVPGRPLNVEGLAQVHRRVGEALAWKGETEAALKHYRKALALFQELATSAEGNPDWLAGVAAANQWVGSVLMERGDLPEAARFFEAACDAFRSLVEKDASELEWRLNLGVCQYSLAKVVWVRGNRAGALDHILDSIATLERVLDEDPTRGVVGDHLAVAHETAAGLLKDGQRFGEAEVHLNKLLGVGRKRLEDDPERASHRHLVANGLVCLGDLHVEQERPDAAIPLFREAEEHLEVLLVLQPDAFEYLHLLAQVQRGWASALRSLGNHAQAYERATRAISIYEGMSEEQRQRKHASAGVAKAYLEAAGIAADRRDYEQALAWGRRSVQVTARLVRAAPGHVGWRLAGSHARRLTAVLLMTLGQPVEGLAMLREARQTYVDLVEEYPEEMPFAHNLGVLESMLHRNEVSFGVRPASTSEEHWLRALQLRDDGDLPASVDSCRAALEGPALRSMRNLYNAACFAALAAAADERRAAEWRAQAFAWLEDAFARGRADIEVLKQNGAAADAVTAAQAGLAELIAWGREGDPDLTVLRGRPEFTRLFEGIDPDGAKPRDDAE